MRKNMKYLWIVVFVTVFIVMVPTISSDFFTNNNKNENQSIYEQYQKITFSEEDLILQTYKDYDILSFTDCGYLNDIGKPLLPTKQIRIALPQGMLATDIQLMNFKEYALPGTYYLLPAQPVLPTLHATKQNEFVQPEWQTYSSSEYYPSQFLELTRQTDLAGQSIAVVTFYPLHYIPFEQCVMLTTEIEFVIKGTNGYGYGDYLPAALSQHEQEQYKTTIMGMVENPEDVVLQVQHDIPEFRSIDPADYRYVIITKNDWVDEFQPLADWKTKKGMPATIVTLDDIQQWYGDDTEVEIRQFIYEAYLLWGTQYVLLGGDSYYIPYYIKTINVGNPDGWDIPTDTPYSDIDNDYTCEVHVGRASVYHTGDTAGGIANFINKLLTYEQNPPLTDYGERIALFGFDADYYTDGEDTKIDINNAYIPNYWEVTTVYDSDAGNHEYYARLAINEGQNFINHIDHCNWNYMGTGDFNHGWGFDVNEVDAFYNGDKQSIFYTIGCWPNAFDYGNCIGEHFVRDTNGGGVAFIGNSRYGFYYQGQDDGASLRYDRYFFRSLFTKGKYRLGECFSDHKNDAYDSQTPDNLNRYIFTTLTLLGDPEMPMWTVNPTELETVDYPDSIPLGSQQVTITVTDDGNGVSGALVCLQKEGDVYAYGTTDFYGEITFDIEPTTPGTMDLTITERLFLPYETTISVAGTLPGDVNGDGIVNTEDLLLLLGAWGPNPGHPADFDGDGVVGTSDLLILLGNWTG